MDFESIKNIIKLVDETLAEKSRLLDYLMKENSELTKRAYAAEDRVELLENHIAELEEKLKELNGNEENNEENIESEGDF